MTPKKPGKPADSADSTPGEAPENLDRVRDILFGGHMRAVEGRIARMEERLAREQETVRAGLEKSIKGLEAFTRKELESVAEKLKADRARAADDLKALGADVKESLKGLDRRLAQLDQATGNADADLRSQLLERQREAAAELQRLGETLTAELRKTEQSLRAEKADLSSLLAIFSDVAVKLSEELQPPPES
jgi:hypothetical protein